MRLLLVLLLLPFPAFAETWQCSNGFFTDRVAALGTRDDCRPFSGSQICGSGRNKYITPARAGLDVTMCSTASSEVRSPLSAVQPSGRDWYERPLKSATRTELSEESRGKGVRSDGALDTYKSLFSSSEAGPAISNAFEFIKAGNW